jgi:hypothetical protein
VMMKKVKEDDPNHCEETTDLLCLPLHQGQSGSSGHQLSGRITGLGQGLLSCGGQ